MTVIRKYKSLRQKRQVRVRSKVREMPLRPRLSVFRSNRHIYAQIIDDERGHTLLSVSDWELTKESLPNLQPRRGKTLAYKAGRLLAAKALKQGVSKVVFDRGGYLFHGRVKALAEGARQGGLSF